MVEVIIAASPVSSVFQSDSTAASSQRPGVRATVAPAATGLVNSSPSPDCQLYEVEAFLDRDTLAAFEMKRLSGLSPQHVPGVTEPTQRLANLGQPVLLGEESAPTPANRPLTASSWFRAEWR